MTSDSPPPKGGSSRPLLDLSGLLDNLHQLYLQIGGRLLQQRLRPHDTETAAQEVNIEGKLERRLADVAAHAWEDAADADSAKPGPPRSAKRPARPAPQAKGGMLGGLRSKLAQGFGRRASAQPQLHLAEKMQASTWEHINKAQLLARQGKLGSARLHAGLAESAMETASRYMGSKEYAALKTDVEARIRAIGAK